MNVTTIFSLPPNSAGCLIPVLWKEGVMSEDASSDSVKQFVVLQTRKHSRAKVRGTAEATATRKSTVHAVSPVDVTSLPLDWILNPLKGLSLSERVLAQLLLAEAKAQDYDEKLAHRLAWHIVLHAMQGDAVECSATTLAYYTVVGCHEDQYYDRVMIRRAAMFGTEVNRVPFPKPSSPAKKVSALNPKKEKSA